MILGSGEHVSGVETCRLTDTVLIQRDVVLLLQLTAATIKITAQVKVLGGAVREERSDLSCANVGRNFNIVHTKGDIAFSLSLKNAF